MSLVQGAAIFSWIVGIWRPHTIIRYNAVHGTLDRKAAQVQNIPCRHVQAALPYTAPITIDINGGVHQGWRDTRRCVDPPLPSSTAPLFISRRAATTGVYMTSCNTVVSTCPHSCGVY